MRLMVHVLALVLLAAPAQSQLEPSVSARIDSIFTDLDRTHAPGCAVGVVRNGHLVFERGYGMGNLDHGIPLDGNSVFYLASVSKQFAAAAILIAEHEGHLSRNDLVQDHIPEFPDYGEPVTVRDLVHHTSGIRDYLTLLSLGGRSLENVLSDEEMLSLITRQEELNFSPGSEYLYSNSGYVLLAEIIERATGRSLRDYAQQVIFGPLGMSDTHFHDDARQIVPRRVFSYSPRADGGWQTDYLMNFDKVGDGGLYSTIRDLARWDAAFYDERLGVPGFAEAMYERGVLTSGDTIGYAAGLNVDRWRGVQRVVHGGSLMSFRTTIARFPDARATVIQLCNNGGASPNALPALAEAIVPGLEPPPEAAAPERAPASDGVPPEEEGGDQPDPAFDLGALAGDYYSHELGSTWRLRVGEGGLTLHHPNGNTLALTTTDGTRFSGGSLQISFDAPEHFLLQAGRVRNLRFARVR
jgi:CubicO group peptidase (beta-lactamase class C family)